MHSSNTSRASHWELARLFLYLGSTSIGGPAAHIARMNEELVDRRRWISDREFLDMIAAANLLPGPNSTEVALHIGYRRAGLPGLLIAGLCFIAPAAILVSLLAGIYVRYGTLPRFENVLLMTKPVVIAIILKAAFDLGRTAIKSRWLLILASLAVVANALGVHELLVLFSSGLVALAARPGKRAFAVFLAVPPAAAAAAPAGIWPLFAYFLKVGSVLYGSGYVLVALLRADLVVRLGWITEQQLLDAVAVGQATPGPLFTTATFIGYVLMGPWGALMATVGIFLPAFVLVAATHSLVRKAREIPWAAVLLDGINAAAIALILVVAWELSHSVLTGVMPIAILIAAALLLFRGIASIWIIGGAVVLGLIR